MLSFTCLPPHNKIVVLWLALSSVICDTYDCTHNGDEPPKDYRPAFSKIFKRVIYNRLQFHIHSNNILAKEQYSFRTNSSTQLATYSLTNDILTALDSNLLVEDNSVILQNHLTVCNVIYYLQNWSTMVFVLCLMSTMSYGIIFWCNSPYSNSIFEIQKRIRRTIMNAG